MEGGAHNIHVIHKGVDSEEPTKLTTYLEEELPKRLYDDALQPKSMTSAALMNLSYDNEAVFRFKSGKSISQLDIQWEQYGRPVRKKAVEDTSATRICSFGGLYKELHDHDERPWPAGVGAYALPATPSSCRAYDFSSW